MEVSAKDFRNFLDKCVKENKMTEQQMYELEYTCAELSLRPDQSALQKFISKVENDIYDNGKLTMEIR
jgi:hypothetical protein